MRTRYFLVAVNKTNGEATVSDWVSQDMVIKAAAVMQGHGLITYTIPKDKINDNATQAVHYVKVKYCPMITVHKAA